ncbi:hypothetical protein [Cellulomonas sp. S1-8]|uniref:hypothetical protein n=1 Tax=Cellulomonas sp. S1-8 TaxID=2904790 RepID=UPI002243FE1C|nr:hypothetical protein [Cellulomonas sp. S1-8]UZN02006.1 hypothetical protein OKX07_13020 [Cellulomonas sp. S1-8]
MSRSGPRWTAQIDELGVEKTRVIIERIITSLAPRYLEIDAYRICEIDEQAEVAMRELAHSRQASGGASVRVDPENTRALKNLVTFAPYSAGVEIGLSGPEALLLQIHDADWIGLHLTDAQIAASRLHLDAAWEEQVSN